MRYGTLALALLVVGVAGCAQHSVEITPAFVSTQNYDSYSCKQLKSEKTRLTRDHSQYADVQDMIAARDEIYTAASLFLFAFPLLLTTGGNADPADEISHLKGQLRAVEKVSITKNCPV